MADLMTQAEMTVELQKVAEFAAIRHPGRRVLTRDIIDAMRAIGTNGLWFAMISRCRDKAFGRQLYFAYLASAAWQKKRREALARNSMRCGAMLRVSAAGPDAKVRCMSIAVDVHHCTYERLGDEAEGDLLPLCRDCHRAIHGKD